MIRALLFFLMVCLCSQAQASTTIEAQVVRNQSGTGSTFISSGFPFPPGLVTEQIITDGKIKVIVDGAEVAANVSALRGRHADGTVRSALIQFTVASMAQNDTITASVLVDGGVRLYPDPAYVRPTLTIVQNNNVILPTSKTYLSTTRISLRGMLPTGSGTSQEEAFYTALAEDRFDALAAASSPNDVMGMASYEHVSALISMWARSGDKKYQKEMIRNVLFWLPYNTPDTATQTPSCRDIASFTNPDGRTTGTGNGCAIPAEWYFSRTFSYAQAYLLTGYRDFWGIVAMLSQYQQTAKNSQATMYANFIDQWGSDYPRQNYAQGYGAILAALMIDATIPVNGQYFDGRAFNWENQLTWTIDAIEHFKFDASGQYWDGLAAGSLLSNSGRTTSIPEIPTFQLIFPANFLIDTYLYYKADARIPDLVQKTVDVILANIREKQSGDVYYSNTDPTWGTHTYVKNYPLSNPPDLNSYTYLNGPGGNATIPFELPEYARMIAFVIKTKGDSTVNGATYSQWYNRVINTANVAPALMNWEWKYFGQFYGFGADAPWIMAQSSLSGHSSIRTPTYYASIPGDTPDLDGSNHPVGRRAATGSGGKALICGSGPCVVPQ